MYVWAPARLEGASIGAPPINPSIPLFFALLLVQSAQGKQGSLAVITLRQLPFPHFLPIHIGHRSRFVPQRVVG